MALSESGFLAEEPQPSRELHQKRMQKEQEVVVVVVEEHRPEPRSQISYPFWGSCWRSGWLHHSKNRDCSHDDIAFELGSAFESDHHSRGP